MMKKSNKVEPDLEPGCLLCGVQWEPSSTDIWGPSITSLQGMQVKVESHEFKSFQKAAEDYANKHLQRRPNNSIGCLEETKLRAQGEARATHVLQVVGNHFINHCKQQETPSFVVSDLFFHYSSYYKKILAKQHEMNDSEGDTTEYVHDPRLILVTPKHGLIFCRALEVGDRSTEEEIGHEMKRAKEMLDKDCIFFWRLFQDIFHSSTVNFTGLLVLPNISGSVSERLVCKKDSDFTVFRRHLESPSHFSDWCSRHLHTKKTLTREMFVEVVTRLNGLYVLIETPQQNLDSKEAEEGEGEGEEDRVLQRSPHKKKHGKKHHRDVEAAVVKHVCKVLMTPQQYEIFTSHIRHRVLFGEYGSGKTQVLVERVRQTAWEMHYSKTDSIIYLFSFADVEESGKLSLNECLLSHFLMSINRNYSDSVAPPSSARLFSTELLPPEIHVKVVIASMRQLVRLKEGKTAKITDIPGFLTQCMQSKVRQNPNTLVHIFIDEIPFSSFLDDLGAKWQTLVATVSPVSCVWLTSRLPLYLWFQDDREENSHVLTDFFLEELLRTNVTGNSMFHLPDSFQVSFFSQVMRSHKPILVLMKEYYNLSQSAQQSFHAAKKQLARNTRSPSKDAKALAKAKLTSQPGQDDTPLWLPLPKCMCHENPSLKKKSDNKYCGCFVPRLAFIIDYMLSLLGISVKPGEEAASPTSDLRLSDLLICCDTNSLHLLKRLGQALHIVDIDFIIYESDTWTNPHYTHEPSSSEDRLEASGSALGHVDKVLITTTLGGRGLEKKIVVYISPENMGDFLAIVKEKNFIEVVSRSINQVIIITVDDPKEGSLNPASVIDSIESVESMAWPNPLPERTDLDLSGHLTSRESTSFVGLLKRLKHRGLLKETRLPMEEYFPSGLT